MAYLALYRKYRPQTFNDIMGQGHVTRTLQNAIRGGRVAHAYLFCGPRGTAKTTTARVLAKAMNCEHGPTPDPDDTCEACVRIREGHSLDVVEIDAASNRGIDDIKLLREQVGRASAQERYKFYIIDEVHQLSADAFQALLKTLEEPPPNVIFVLATTETHRVPKTIVSRCQRFDFRRGTMKDLSDRLRYVVDNEGMQADPEALSAIARAAAGGWRDALSLLEQVAAFSPEKIDLAAVNAVLGSVEESALFRLTDAMASGDTSILFRETTELVGDGKEPRQLLAALGGHLRDLLWAQSGAEEAADLSPEMAVRYKAQAGKIPAPFLMRALETIHRAESQMRWVSDHRLLLELTLLKIANGGGIAESDSVLGPVSTGTPAARTAAPSQPQPRSARTAPTPPAPPRTEPVATPQAPSALSEWDDSYGEPPPPDDSLPVAPKAVTPKAVPEVRATPERTTLAPTPAPSAFDPEEYASDEESIEGGYEDVWRQIGPKVKPSVKALLKHGTPLGIQNKVFRVGFTSQGYIVALEGKTNKDQVEAALKSITGLDLRIKGEPIEASANGAGVPTSAASAPPPTKPTSDSFFPSQRVNDSASEYVSDAEFARIFNAEKLSEGEP